jgi:hypothetical protein
VREFIPGERIRLRGENKTVTAIDTMTFRSIDAGTEVTYTAEFTFKGPAVGGCDRGASGKDGCDG